MKSTAFRSMSLVSLLRTVFLEMPDLFDSATEEIRGFGHSAFTTAHTVTSNVSGQFNSGLLTTGQTWSFTFTQAGTYHYYCAVHPMMTGAVVVTSG